MGQAQQEHKRFLEQQLLRTEEQVHILDEMKRIAEYALKHEFTPIETERLNAELNVLKNEFNTLEKQLYPVLQ